MAKNKQSGDTAGRGSPDTGGLVEKKFKIKEVAPEELEDIQEASDEIEAEEQEGSAVQLTQRDFCPACGTFSNGHAIQMKFQLPIGAQMVVVGLPSAICLTCGCNYTPMTMLERMLNPEPESQIVLARPNVRV